MTLTPEQAAILDRLLLANYRALERWARILADRYRMDVEDVWSVGYWKIARGFPGYDPRRSAFVTWAARAFEWAVVNCRVTERRAKRPEFREISDRQWLALADPEGSPEVSVVDRLGLEDVLQELPLDQRLLLERRAAGWTLDELGQESGVSRSLMSYRVKQAEAAARAVASRKLRGGP